MPEQKVKLSHEDLLVTNPRWLTIPGLIHGTTTRAALPHPGKDDFFVTLRRARTSGALPNTITIGADQVHGARIQLVSEPIDMARQPTGYRTDPLLGAAEFPATDALITDLPGVMLIIQTADCLPVFLIDRQARVVGLAHCGWRGLHAGLAGKLAAEMALAGAPPERLEAWLGPCIRVERYEVGPELVEKFMKAFPGYPVSPNGSDLDLTAIAHRQLLDAGLPASNIVDSGECTLGNPERYHSYRGQGGDAGRMYSFICFDLKWPGNA